MQIRRTADINATAARLVAHWKAGKYGNVSAKTGVPLVWIAASFEREASSNFALSAAQGDRWNRVSVHVPAGRGPFDSWEAAALDAYHIDHLDRVGAGHWTWELGCYFGEAFNGPGYRAHGIPSPYLWGGTTIQKRGKYVADGVFDATVMDSQLGIIPIMRRMIELEPGLDFTAGRPPTPPPPIPTPPPKKLPPKKPPVHPGTGPIVVAGGGLAAWLHDHWWLLAIVGIAAVALLIWLHEKPAPNLSPKAIEPEPAPTPVPSTPANPPGVTR